MTDPLTPLHGIVLNEETRCSLADLCRLSGVNAEMIHEMIEEGILSPSGQTVQEWRFTVIDLRRTRTVVRLQHDLRVNLPGCALVLDLLDELEELRRYAQRHRR